MRDPSRAFVGAAVFAVAVAAFSRIPLLPQIGADLTLTAGEIGLLISAFGLGRLFTDLPAGRIAGAASPEAALSGAGLVLAGSCALLAVSQSLAEALVASGLIGCASAVTNTTGMYAFATGAPPDRRGASMAFFVTALMTGQMVGPTVGGAIASLTGWRPALGVAAGIGLGVALGCGLRWRWTRRTPVGRRDAGSGERGAIDPPTARYATRAELLALAAAPFATFFGLAGLTQTLIPLIGDGELGLSASAVGLAVGLGAAIRFFGAWAAGAASDRLSRKVVLVPSLATMAAGAGALALSPTTLTWAVGIALVALGSSGISVAAAAVADGVPHERLGHELGVFRLLGDLGLLVGPAITGFAYGAAGPELAGLLSAAVFVAAAVATLVWVRTPAARGGEPEDTGRAPVELMG